MSCEYCNIGWNMLNVVEDAGCAIDSICIKDGSFVTPQGHPNKPEKRIVVNVSDGKAYTLPLKFCPMCGESLKPAKKIFTHIVSPKGKRRKIHYVPNVDGLGACAWVRVGIFKKIKQYAAGPNVVNNLLLRLLKEGWQLEDAKERKALK